MKNFILYVSVFISIVMIGLVASAFLTTRWDYQLFQMSLDGMCPIIKEKNSDEYKGFIQRVCEKKTVEQFAAEQDAAEEAAFFKTLKWNLTFGTQTILLDRMGSGVIENTFWQKKITSTETATETFDTIFAKYFNVDDGFVYDTGKNRYYDLAPGGYDQLRIVTDAEYQELAKPIKTETVVEAAGVTVIHVSEPFLLDYTGGPVQWKAVKKSGFHVMLGEKVSDKKNWLSDGFVVVCYLPIEGTTSYLEIDRPMAAASSESNLCDEVSAMGVQSAELVK